MTNIFCFFSIHFPDEKQNALFKVRWQSFVFIWGRFFGPFVFSLKERSDGKKQKGWWRKNILTIEWKGGALWILRVSKCDFRRQGQVLCDENWIKFFYMNKYEFSLKILYRQELRSFIVLTRCNSISRILHDQFIRARMCMFESKGYHANRGGINSSIFYARSWRRNG